jgi:serine/threonine protein kinase
MVLSLSRANFIPQSTRRLEETYSKESKLGEGAFGSVFLSRHKETSELRAIKFIPKSSIKHPERLKNEVSTLMSCDHPHIIKLFEIIEDRKTLYLVMEQCKGGELFDYIISHKKIPEAESVALFRQIMLSVTYLHSKNIAHRDLKPENLMFSDRGTLKLIDFGIAKTLKPDEEMTTRAGSVRII